MAETPIFFVCHCRVAVGPAGIARAPVRRRVAFRRARGIEERQAVLMSVPYAVPRRRVSIRHMVACSLFYLQLLPCCRDPRSFRCLPLSARTPHDNGAHCRPPDKAVSSSWTGLYDVAFLTGIFVVLGASRESWNEIACPMVPFPLVQQPRHALIGE